MGFEEVGIPAVEVGGETNQQHPHSTRSNEAILPRRPVSWAAIYILGTVVEGDHLGKHSDFPANLTAHNEQFP